MQSLGIDEKHDPINGHSRPSVGTPGLSGMGATTSGPSAHSSGLLPGANGKGQDNKKKMHPAVIIVLWIALSSSVIVYNKCVPSARRSSGQTSKETDEQSR